MSESGCHSKQLSAKSCASLLAKVGIKPSGTVECLPFRVEQAYVDGEFQEFDIVMAWLHDQGWKDII
jgi:hypothetical protein